MDFNEALQSRIATFKSQYPLPDSLKARLIEPSMPFYGTKILTQAVTALLEGENLLLCGDKATGKNILAENLAWIFGRPTYNISFHVNTDSSSLIGTDTFKNNEVTLRQGPIYQCAVSGGFGILDEINMAKNDAVAVLHAVLDYRRIMDVPGYEKIALHPATRFIGTMNYGYAGTKELNEALVSRFMVINMPPLSMERLEQIFKKYLSSHQARCPGTILWSVFRLTVKSKKWRNFHKGSRYAWAYRCPSPGSWWSKSNGAVEWVLLIRALTILNVN